MPLASRRKISTPTSPFYTPARIKARIVEALGHPVRGFSATNIRRKIDEQEIAGWKEGKDRYVAGAVVDELIARLTPRSNSRTRQDADVDNDGARAEPGAVERTEATRPRRTSPRRASRMRRDESGERVAVCLPPDLATELRMLCARERRSVSDAVTDAVSALVKRGSPKGRQG
ncbi:MAG: hypothetical protein HYV09_06800 [Deltaproteobacteria bacterium]|nr:hypothetical protein [Deltaproteobacteria bacterium]